MRVQLVVKNPGKQQGMAIPITVRQFLIGREEGCQLRPASELISKRHCAILIATQGIFVEDFKSTNGTRVNGTAIQGRVPVKHGDTLSVGTLDFELQVLATAPAAQAKPVVPAGTKPGSIASPTPIPPTSMVVQAMAGQVGAAPAQPPAQAKPVATAPAAQKPAPPAPVSTPNSSEPSAVDDDLAALLMDDDAVSDSKAALMEAPTVAEATEETKAIEAPGANQPYGGAPSKPTPAMSSSDSARALLDKLMRRPR